MYQVETRSIWALASSDDPEPSTFPVVGTGLAAAVHRKLENNEFLFVLFRSFGIGCNKNHKWTILYTIQGLHRWHIHEDLESASLELYVALFFPSEYKEGNSRRRGNVVFVSTYCFWGPPISMVDMETIIRTVLTRWVQKKQTAVKMTHYWLCNLRISRICWYGAFPSLFFFWVVGHIFFAGAGQITGTCNQVRDNLRVHVIRLTVRCGTLSGHFFEKTSALFTSREFPSSSSVYKKKTVCVSSSTKIPKYA